jgi:lipoprotein NlpI
VYKRQDYEGALKDYNKAIEIDSQYGYAYLNRGITYEMLRKPVLSCEDWKKAATLGVTTADGYVKLQCK